MKHIDSNGSRRRFLRAAASSSAATLLGAAWTRSCWSVGASTSSNGPDARVAQIKAKTIGIDMHNHVYPLGTEPHRQPGPPGGGGQPPERELSLADELKRSGLTAVCASFVLDFAPNEKPGDALANYLRWLTAIDTALAKGKIRRALNLKDLRAAHDTGHPTIVQTVEGSQFIEGKLDRVEVVYKRGLRHLQLLHDQDDKVAPLGDMNTSVAHLGGLTPFGARVVKECNRLGIVVDMAHASHATVLGALEVATRPLVISHTSLDSRTGGNPRMVEMMKPRLISKEHAKVVADAGGIVGVWTHLADSLTEFVESIKAMVDAIGVDHVGMGTDTDLLSTRQGTNTWSGLDGGFFDAVIGEMLRQGFAPDDVVKVGGGNYCRVFDKVTSGHHA